MSVGAGSVGGGSLSDLFGEGGGGGGAPAAGGLLDNLTYVGSFDVSVDALNPDDVAISDAGTTVFVLSGQVGDLVLQYDLSTPFDPTTAAYASKSLDVATPTGELTPTAMTVKPDGTKLYISGFTTDAIHEFTMSTPWDLSTATYTTSSGVLGTNPEGLTFAADGSYLFAVVNTTVVARPLTTPWDLSTMGSTTTGPSIAGASGCILNSDGTSLLITSETLDMLLRLEMSTPYDITTNSYAIDAVCTRGLELNLQGCDIDATDTYIVVTGSNSDAVHIFSR